MNPMKKGQLREADRYMWGCGRSPHPHIYPSLLLEGGFFSALINDTYCLFYDARYVGTMNMAGN